MNPRAPNSKKDKAAVRAELKKYNLTLKGWRDKDSVLTVKGSKEDIRDFVLKCEWADVYDDSDIDSYYPQLKTDEVLEKELAISSLYDAINREYRKDAKGITKWFAWFISENPKITADELHNLSLKDFKYKIKAEEYISVGARASVWTTYLTGELKFKGKKYEKKISIDSKANRL
jgi:hypothetical protein